MMAAPPSYGERKILSKEELEEMNAGNQSMLVMPAHGLTGKDVQIEGIDQLSQAKASKENESQPNK